MDSTSAATRKLPQSLKLVSFVMRGGGRTEEREGTSRLSAGRGGARISTGRRFGRTLREDAVFMRPGPSFTNESGGRDRLLVGAALTRKGHFQLTTAGSFLLPVSLGQEPTIAADIQHRGARYRPSDNTWCP